MLDHPLLARVRGSSTLMVAIVGLVVACWIVGNPRTAGPDEGSHQITSAGLVRGDGEGAANPADTSTHLFELPGMVGAPDPGCWALQPDVPVACANSQLLTTDTRVAATTSYNYAPWAFALPGLASFVPWAGGYAYLARGLNAAVPVLLVAGSLVLLIRGRRVAAAAAFLALTPIAWFTFGIVNPSAVAIGGGLALWSGLLAPRPDRLSRVLTIAGFAGVLLARRDGPLWASAIVVACCALVQQPPAELWRALGPRLRWLPVALLPLPLLQPLTDGDRGFNALLAVATASIGLAELIGRWWQRTTTTTARVGIVAYTTLAAAVVIVFTMLRRPGGFRAETLRLVAGNTGEHLRQLVGVLGWLDAPVPSTGVLLWWAAIGGLATVAWLECRRVAAGFVLALVFAISAAWLLELGQGSNDGTYWQGRYTLPFAIGIPILLTWRPPVRETLVDRLSTELAAVGWIVANLAFFAAQRRWGVGVNGSWYPWDWNTWGAPMPPGLLVVIHAVLTGALAATVCEPRRVRA